MKKELRDKVSEFFNDVDVQEMVIDLIDDKTKQIALETLYQLPAGELIDKFVVCHARIWHLEEKITSDVSDEVVAQASRQLRLVNAERAKLREEINRRFDGYEVGTQKSYMVRMDLLRQGVEDQEPSYEGRGDV